MRVFNGRGPLTSGGAFSGRAVFSLGGSPFTAWVFATGFWADSGIWQDARAW